MVVSPPTGFKEPAQILSTPVKPEHTQLIG